MTTKELLQNKQSKGFEVGVAIAIGTALAAGVTPAIGAGVYTALCVLALREKKSITIREGVALAVGALAAGLTVAGAISIIENWSSFKEGVIQGYRRR